jgi:hypothetical protein
MRWTPAFLLALALMFCNVGPLHAEKGLLKTPKKELLQAEDPEPSPPEEQEMTRLEVAQTLLTHFQIPPSWTLSELSPFRDVSTNDPDYPLLETAWQFNVLTPKSSWRLLPHAPMSQLDVWMALKGLLFTQESLKDAYNLALLSEDKSFEALPESVQRDLAVLYEHYVFDVFRDLPLTPNTPVTDRWLNERLAFLPQAQELLSIDAKRGFTGVAWRLIPSLGSGFSLVISPQEAILGPRLRLGQTLFFRLNVPLYPSNKDVIVEDSSLAGTITKLEKDAKRPELSWVTVTLNTVRNGHSNVVWRLKADLRFPILTVQEQSLSSLGELNTLKQAERQEVQNYILPTQQFTTNTTAIESP